jgi:nitrile hydratase subunit beta
LFHAAWERRVLGFTLAMGGTGSWTIDQSRHEREKLPPAFYWTAGYYEIWMAGLVNLMKVRGLVTDDEVAAGRAMKPALSVTRVLKAVDVADVLKKGSQYERQVTTAAKFKVGQTVCSSNVLTTGHTRLPNYARNKRGVIDEVHGAHVFADASGMGKGENPQWLYRVRFEAETLWGQPSRDSVFIDLWEPYLEAAA